MCDVSYQSYHVLRVKDAGNTRCHVTHQTHWVAEKIHRAQDLDGLTSDSLGSGGREEERIEGEKRQGEREAGRKGGREGMIEKWSNISKLSDFLKLYI